MYVVTSLPPLLPSQIYFTHPHHLAFQVFPLCFFVSSLSLLILIGIIVFLIQILSHSFSFLLRLWACFLFFYYCNYFLFHALFAFHFLLFKYFPWANYLFLSINKFVINSFSFFLHLSTLFFSYLFFSSFLLTLSYWVLDSLYFSFVLCIGFHFVLIHVLSFSFSDLSHSVKPFSFLFLLLYKIEHVSWPLVLVHITSGRIHSFIAHSFVHSLLSNQFCWLF